MRKTLLIFVVFLFTASIAQIIFVNQARADVPTEEICPNVGGVCDRKSVGSICTNAEGKTGTCKYQPNTKDACGCYVSLDVWGSKYTGKTGGKLAGETGLGVKDPREVAAQVINIILGFLGIIAVILIIYGGFLWMTAAGNEDKVSTAKKLLAAGVVGLIIILAAFGIANFVINALMGATGAGA